MGNKFYIKVPTMPNEKLDYMDCYVYGYIYKKPTTFLLIQNNLKIRKFKLKNIVKKLIENNLISIKNKIFHINETENILYKFEEKFLYDRTYIPNINFLDIKQNAIFWRLYRYSDQVEGMDDYYTIITNRNIHKINYKYISNVLKFPVSFVKKSIFHLKNLGLLRTQIIKSEFYFGIQPIKNELKIYWQDEEKNIENNWVCQKELVNSYNTEK
jgi:hypothetical protein